MPVPDPASAQSGVLVAHDPRELRGEHLPDSEALTANGPAGGNIWDNGGALRRVTAKSAVGGYYDNVGDASCLAGRFNHWCGTITALWVTTVEAGSGITIYNGRCASYLSQEGDSGGAVWGPQYDGTAAAQGLHRGTFDGICPGPLPKLYTHIGFALSALGLWDIIYG